MISFLININQWLKRSNINNIHSLKFDYIISDCTACDIAWSIVWLYLYTRSGCYLEKWNWSPEPIQDGSEKIQAVEIQGKAGDRLHLISVYLPAKGSKNHQIEYHDCVDQLYELYQKYRDSHTIVIGGDMNEDLNNPISNKRNQYLLDFIRETQLAYNNSSKTFVNSMG